MSNTRYNHVEELIHCSHQMQCKAGTGSPGWLGKVQCRLQQSVFLFSPKSCQRSVDSGLFLSCDALMDIFSGSVKSIARFVHLDSPGCPQQKMSQPPEIQLGGQQLWPLPGQCCSRNIFHTTPSRRNPQKPPLSPFRHSCLFATGVGSRAALPVAGSPRKTDPAMASARHHPASAKHRSGYPGAGTATAAASSLHPAPPP